jgi:hypothetical protein
MWEKINPWLQDSENELDPELINLGTQSQLQSCNIIKKKIIQNFNDFTSFRIEPSFQLKHVQ